MNVSDVSINGISQTFVVNSFGLNITGVQGVNPSATATPASVTITVMNGARGRGGRGGCAEEPPAVAVYIVVSEN